MKDNKTKQEILDWWIMNTDVEYRSSNINDQELKKKVLLGIDKELLLSREMTKNRLLHVVSEKEITDFFWKVYWSFRDPNGQIYQNFRIHNRFQKEKKRHDRKLMKERGKTKKEIDNEIPKPNQICLQGIFLSLRMNLLPLELREREEEREKMKVTK